MLSDSKLKFVKKVVAVVSALSLTVLALLGAGYYLIQETVVWDRDIAKQQIVVQAYISFIKKFGEPPHSLSELVSRGVLPRRAWFYREPPGFGNQETGYESSSYEVFYPRSVRDEDLYNLIGRREGPGSLHFELVTNSELRDAVLDWNARTGHKLRK